MESNGLSMKSFIATDSNLYDVNDKFLESGKYYFMIQHFTKNNSVIGIILSSNNNIKENTQYEFRFFSLMTMMVKGQSYLAHRVDKNLLSETVKSGENFMPDYPSPKKTESKRLSFLKNKNKKIQCMICLTESDGYDFSFKKLKCGHKFHLHCINEWKTHSSSCPVCRKDITC